MRANGQDFRLSLAGPNAKAPGSVNVCSIGGYNDRAWYGRVSVSGEFEPCRRYDAATQTAVAGALQAMASDPAKAASAYGLLTGVCCFCGRTLSDERSTAVGYGKICSDHYGVPYPSLGEARAAHQPILSIAA